ncbi:jg26223 [Pararge aegeria aegeria]|uniref:Jg26223 protein n=1 Tax=Pararge aegeria aegeria TaxID=348720 RepID=A0A8S4RWX7_9NEOP|nr:jg26223 [Pararge aegeria aegeria]
MVANYHGAHKKAQSRSAGDGERCATSIYVIKSEMRRSDCGASIIERSLAANHLRGCYGVTGGVGRVRKLAMRRAPGLDDIGASCEGSDLDSVRP